MKPGTKKTVRLATTFTGTAACALTFAPTALAGTSQPTAQPGHRVNLKTAAPDITRANCQGTNQSHWFHMGFHIGNLATVTCFGGTGTFILTSDIFINSECGGNNKGYISGVSSGVHRKITWNHGTTYRNIGALSVSKVHISSFSGTDKCPTFP